MKKEIVTQSNFHQSPRTMRGTRGPAATFIAVVALIAFASSSALATQCEPAEFSESGGFPSTAYIYVTTATPGATIFATVGNHFIPADPTHSGGSPTGTTFICGGTFAVFVGDSKYVKAVVYKAGMTDSAMTSYALDNTGN
jgi:hypothetical protein